MVSLLVGSHNKKALDLGHRAYSSCLAPEIEHNFLADTNDLYYFTHKAVPIVR